jgi:hypothetical protein
VAQRIRVAVLGTSLVIAICLFEGLNLSVAAIVQLLELADLCAYLIALDIQLVESPKELLCLLVILEVEAPQLLLVAFLIHFLLASALEYGIECSLNFKTIHRLHC